MLFTSDVKICQMDQRCRCQKRAENVMCEQGLSPTTLFRTFRISISLGVGVDHSEKAVINQKLNGSHTETLKENNCKLLFTCGGLLLNVFI